MVRAPILRDLDDVLASLAKLEDLGLVENEEARAVIRTAITTMVTAIEAIEVRLAVLENASRPADMH
jgi:hypothetical protein